MQSNKKLSSTVATLQKQMKDWWRRRTDLQRRITDQVFREHTGEADAWERCRRHEKRNGNKYVNGHQVLRWSLLSTTLHVAFFVGMLRTRVDRYRAPHPDLVLWVPCGSGVCCSVARVLCGKGSGPVFSLSNDTAFAATSMYR